MSSKYRSPVTAVPLSTSSPTPRRLTVPCAVTRQPEQKATPSTLHELLPAVAPSYSHCTTCHAAVVSADEALPRAVVSASKTCRAPPLVILTVKRSDPDAVISRMEVCALGSVAI